MNILVVGGDGFIGSHMVDTLIAASHQVTVFDRCPYQVTRNLEHLKGRVKIVSGEFANKIDLKNAMEGKDVVFHFVWASSPITSWNDPLIEVDTNIRLSVQLLETAVDAGVKKIVFPSSGGTIYGLQPAKKIDESCVPRPFSPYGIAKLSVEHFMNYFREAAGLACDIYRIGNAFGPRQPISAPQGVIAVWMSKILAGEKIIAYGDNSTLRDYVYVKDIAYLMTHSLSDLHASATINIGSGRGTSIVRLLEIFKNVIDIPFDCQILPKRASDNTSIVLDNTLILKHFPDFEFRDIQQQISETWKSFRTLARHASSGDSTNVKSAGPTNSALLLSSTS